MDTNINKWRKYPDEEPLGNGGEYLCKGKCGLDDKEHFYVCLWVNEPAHGLKGFFYGGNYFNGSFEYIKCSEL